MTQVKPIELAAIGRVAKFGELYDARSDQFLHLSLIKSNLPSTAITSTQNRQTRLKYSMVNTLEEKFKILDIQGELKMSIMSGLLSLEGSGKFFKDKKRSAKSAKASLISSFLTVFEDINITDTEICEIINFKVLKKIDATHVVIGIQWGGNVFISVEDSNNDDQDQKQIEGRLNAQISQMLSTAISVGASTSITFDEIQRNELNKFSFEIYGDLLPETTPQTLIDAIHFMKSAPKMLLESNNGKGKAIKYSLLPISLVRQIFKKNNKINMILNKIDEAIVDKCTKLFDEMNTIEQKFNDILDELNIYEKYISTEKSKFCNKLYQKYKVFQSEVERNLSEQLILIRSGTEKIDKLRNMLNHAVNDLKFISDFENFSFLKEEFKFIKLLKQLNVYMLDKEISMQEYLSLNFNKDIYTFFYRNNFPANTEKPMMIFRNILENKQAASPDAIFTAVKIDVLNENERKVYFNFKKSTKLSMYRNCLRVIDNCELNPNIINELVRHLSVCEDSSHLCRSCGLPSGEGEEHDCFENLVIKNNNIVSEMTILQKENQVLRETIPNLGMTDILESVRKSINDFVIGETKNEVNQEQKQILIQYCQDAIKRKNNFEDISYWLYYKINSCTQFKGPKSWHVIIFSKEGGESLVNAEKYFRIEFNRLVIEVFSSKN